MTGGPDPTWLLDQQRAAFADTQRLARSLALSGRAWLVRAPIGPWSSAMLASIQTGQRMRTTCPHLARQRSEAIPVGPRPLIVPRAYRLSCPPCASETVARLPRTACHACGGRERGRASGDPARHQVDGVVAYGRIVILLGVLCRHCMLAEMTPVAH